MEAEFSRSIKTPRLSRYNLFIKTTTGSRGYSLKPRSSIGPILRIEGIHASVARLIFARRYFQWLEKELGLEKVWKIMFYAKQLKPSDWYDVNWNQERKKYKGGALSSFYNDSLVSALPDIYPLMEWDVRKFSKSPNCTSELVTQRTKSYRLLERRRKDEEVLR